MTNQLRQLLVGYMRTK